MHYQESRNPPSPRAPIPAPFLVAASPFLLLSSTFPPQSSWTYFLSFPVTSLSLTGCILYSSPRPHPTPLRYSFHTPSQASYYTSPFVGYPHLYRNLLCVFFQRNNSSKTKTNQSDPTEQPPPRRSIHQIIDIHIFIYTQNSTTTSSSSRSQEKKPTNQPTHGTSTQTAPLVFPVSSYYYSSHSFYSGNNGRKNPNRRPTIEK